jgi:hypothetical protein
MNKVLFRLCALFWLVGAGAFGLHRFACDRPCAEESDPHLLPTAVGEYLDGVASSTD